MPDLAELPTHIPDCGRVPREGARAEYCGGSSGPTFGHMRANSAMNLCVCFGFDENLQHTLSSLQEEIACMRFSKEPFRTIQDFSLTFSMCLQLKKLKVGQKKHCFPKTNKPSALFCSGKCLFSIGQRLGVGHCNSAFHKANHLCFCVFY